MGTVAHIVAPSGFLKRNKIHIAAIVAAHGDVSPSCSAQRLPQENEAYVVTISRLRNGGLSRQRGKIKSENQRGFETLNNRTEMPKCLAM